MLKMILLFVAILASIAAATAAAVAGPTLDRIVLNGEGDFVDAAGRKLLLRGFNSVRKSPPYYDANMLNETRVKLLSEFGFNVVRLGIIWSAAAPNGDGKFNETYLDRYVDTVDLMTRHGIYVMVDMHQDGLSSRYQSYDAVPGWLLDRFPNVYRWMSFPWPLKPFPADRWFEAYLTYECQHSFQAIYANQADAWRHWGDFWERVATRLRNKTGLLGYELINEPFAGNIYKNPLRALPGYAGYHNLLPVYDYLVSRIRKVDKDALIFYEPVTWGVFSPSTSSWFGTGFDRVPGTLEDPMAYRKSVLSYHYYCWILQTADPKTIFPHWKQVVCDELLMNKVFKSTEASVQLTGGGRFLTEFGLCAPDGKPKTINTLECNTIMRLADQHFQSWTYWDSMFFDAQGNPRLEPLKSFSRVYPVATAGIPKTLEFNVTDGSFKYAFEAILPEKPAQEMRSEDIPAGFPILDLFIPETIHYAAKKQYQIKVDPISISYVPVADKISTYRFGSDAAIPAKTLITVSVIPQK